MFQTERLHVRHITDADIDAMFAVYSDADAMRWVDDGQPIKMAECIEWVEVTRRNYEQRGYGLSALVLKQTGAVIGFCGIVHPNGQVEAEIIYALSRDHWGSGLATEAAIGMLEYASNEFGITRFIATTAPENLASHRVLEKAGMTHFETVRDEDDGSWIKSFEWTKGS